MIKFYAPLYVAYITIYCAFQSTRNFLETPPIRKKNKATTAKDSRNVRLAIHFLYRILQLFH